MPAAWAGIAVAGLIIAVIASRFHHDVTRMYEARKHLERGAVLIDVDSHGEFARHHPRMAINIPLEELARRAGEIGPVDQPIVVFAHRWRRGAQAAHELAAMGYRDVLNAAGVRTKEQLNEALVTAAEARANKAETVELAATPS
jgi:rhodanese-related sulfurtransferase